MKQPIRYFSIGVITATVILFITFSFFYQPNHSSSGNHSTSDMIDQIEAEGYHVLTESEYITYSVNKDNQEQDNNDTENKTSKVDEEKNSNKTDKDENSQEEESKKEDKTEEKLEETEEPNVNTYTLIVEPNMLGPNISQLLLDHKIIDDAEKFNRYLEIEGYAPFIQIGEHKVSSDMTYYEIAEKI